MEEAAEVLCLKTMKLLALCMAVMIMDYAPF